MTYQNANLLTFALSFCFNFHILHGFVYRLDSGIWNSGDEIATPRQVGARNDMRDYRTFPRASEANMPPKQRIAKTMNDALMLAWKRG